MSISTKNSLLARPGLNGLMGLYEQNYQRLVRLIPEWPMPFEEAISHSSLDKTLSVRVIERTKYTTTVLLTYWFEEGKADVPDPDMEIRLFHDAQLAEVLACGMNPRSLSFGGFDYKKYSAVDARWGRNLFLNKWLDYLLGHGHGFAVAHRPRLAEVSS